MAKFAPGSVAHPAAWVPQLVRKHLTAVQRDMQGNSLWTTEMTSTRQIPSSSCSFAHYELHVLTGILCYSREKSRDLHSLSTTWRRKPVRPPLCQAFPFPLTFLSQFDYLHKAVSPDDFFKLLFQRLISEAETLSYRTPQPLSVIFGMQPLCI